MLDGHQTDGGAMAAIDNIRQQIRLPAGVAVWVLSAHLYALLIPFLLVLVLNQYAELVSARADYPWVFYLAIAAMTAGSAFEIAQNTFDEWYLQADDASANGTSLCDMLFFWCVVSSQALIIVACKGSWLWVSVPAGLLALLYPVFYLTGRLSVLPLSVVGLASAVVSFLSFGDPVLLLQIVMPAVTMFFFGLLLKTGNQVFHGFTTLAASSGVLILCWGIYRSHMGFADGWLVTVAAVIAAAVLLLGSRRFLASLGATPKPQ